MQDYDMLNMQLYAVTLTIDLTRSQCNNRSVEYSMHTIRAGFIEHKYLARSGLFLTVLFLLGSAQVNDHIVNYTSDLLLLLLPFVVLFFSCSL